MMNERSLPSQSNLKETDIKVSEIQGHMLSPVTYAFSNVYQARPTTFEVKVARLKMGLNMVRKWHVRMEDDSRKMIKTW